MNKQPMTHDKAMEMARGGFGSVLSVQEVQLLADLILRIDTEARQQQREADARVCDERAAILTQHGMSVAADELASRAAAIREGGR